MKKFKFLAGFILLFTAFNFTSCDNEALDGDIDPGTENGGNNGGENGGGTSTGDYWPMAINNQWVFVANSVTQDPMKITSTQQIGGNTHYKYDTFFGTSVSGEFDGEGTVTTRKSNGNYYVRQEVNIPAQEGQPAIVVSPMEFIVFKDNLAVNGTWTQNLTQTTTIQGLPPIRTAVTFKGKILEKNVTMTVNGAEFTNVIKVELIQTTQGVVNTNYYWFSKNVGPIKYQNIFQDYNVTGELDSYSLN